ncbi:Holliday junction resolvase RuvX [Anaerosalibacter bizertensis]|uniref:Putative pre-16S rRNA nuclease n=1 Tax=Anaerosalibacter bizertensis TaxID=932217 RepID=A0A844FFU3_9FIRM|nr:Holliday junction resolvase RuvX [Anaerosalibacter bizertensis]MBV1818165.1 Holliday junction resolvase RuvX [Bacteroidales bacterium MSK.15.36]HHV26088.1 Holliday junction resolvase RuvX [Tissierellia bacterium]MBU5292767.1 Holliday junction resolvase RuvX [Anaerosalibacter bizertensis]MCB5558429.1 Holliday junction resolvase RuvX [Anaerosalibacter bizertensis]MCG4564193.1 Holliday junction resolvase RuvX [Anaerosalibacter bizertensis]
MERILGLDVGDKTIGVAVSDLLGLTAQGITTIQRDGIENDFKALKDIIDEYEIKKIVIGFPKNMNNTVGPQGEKVLKFVEEIKEKFGLEIILEDERLTTVAAERLLINGDVSRKKRKKVIDKVAATYILQTYLDKNY